VKIQPNHGCEASSELLFGESVEVLEQDGLWSKIKSVRDGYEGFVETTACDFSNGSATHWISTRATFLFERADIKSPVLLRLLFGSEVRLYEVTGNPNFLEFRGSGIADNEHGFIWAAHCFEKNTPLTSSMIEIAQSNYLLAPYRWGGRSTDGCDCSGLVQMVAMASGVSLPRDSADQEPALKSDVEYANRAAEDLVFWPGHVGILKSPSLLLHSTAHSMRCCIEPFQDVVQRAGVPSSIKRITICSESPASAS